MFIDCTFYADLTCTVLWVFLFLGIYLGWENVRYLNGDYRIATGFFKRFQLTNLNWWESKNSGIALTCLEIKNAPKYRWSALARLLVKFIVIALIVCVVVTPTSTLAGFLLGIWLMGCFALTIIAFLGIVYVLASVAAFPIFLKKFLKSLLQDLKLVIGK